MSSNWNPGNFANRPQEEVENLASKGGQHSQKGGFASMDPSKQVFTFNLLSPSVVPFLFWARLTSVISKILPPRAARCLAVTNNSKVKVIRESLSLVRGEVPSITMFLMI